MLRAFFIFGVPFVTAPSAPAARLDHRAIRRILIGLMLAMFLSALDQTIVATALATIGRAYANVENLAWIVTAYLLAATVVTPLYGKLSDIYGRRPVLLIGITIFVIGSVACALAPTMPALVASRAIQGLGGGGLIAMSQTIVGDAVSPRERGRYQGYFGAVFATSSIAGPVLGGVFAEHLHWSFIFWINVPLGLLALGITGRALKALPRHERPHELDFLGAALMVTATISLLLALNWGGTRYPWSSAQILGLLGAAVVLFALFFWRIATAAEPFVPLSIMRNRVVAPAIGCACAGLWHDDRAHDLRAGLFRDGAGLVGECRGPHAHSVHGRHGDRLDLRRPDDVEGHALQARSAHRHAVRDCRTAAVVLVHGAAFDRRGRGVSAGRRRRHGHGVSDHHRLGAERRAALAARHRDRRLSTSCVRSRAH